MYEKARLFDGHQKQSLCGRELDNLNRKIEWRKINVEDKNVLILCMRGMLRMLQTETLCLSLSVSRERELCCSPC